MSDQSDLFLDEPHQLVGVGVSKNLHFLGRFSISPPPGSLNTFLTVTPITAEATAAAYTPGVANAAARAAGASATAYTATASVTFTPLTAAASATAYAPSVDLSQTVTPGVAAASAHAYAPASITLSTTVTPGVAAASAVALSPTPGVKYAPVSSTWGLVQSTQTTSASILPFSSSVTAGDCLTVSLLSTAPVTAVSDNINGAWVKLGEEDYLTAVYLSTWGLLRSAAGTPSVTATGLSSGGGMIISELSGIASLDQVAGNQATGKNVTAGPTSAIGHAGELVIGVTWTQNPTLSAGAGFTADPSSQITGGNSFLVEYMTATSTSGQSMAAQTTTNSIWLALVIVLATGTSTAQATAAAYNANVNSASTGLPGTYTNPYTNSFVVPLSTWFPSGYTVAPNSQNTTYQLAQGVPNSGYNLGVNLMPVLTAAASVSNVAVSGPTRNFSTAPIPTAASALISGTGDSPLLVYQPSTDMDWEMWIAAYSGGNWSCQDGASVTSMANSTGSLPNPYGLSGGGLAYIGLIITEGDVYNASVNATSNFGHVVSIEVNANSAKAMQLPYWFPAVRNDGGATDTPSWPTEGMWFVMPASVSMPGGMAPFAQYFFKTLQDYGAIISDNTGGGGVYTVIENTSDWTAQGGSVPGGGDPISNSFNGVASYNVLESIPLSSMVQIIPPTMGNPLSTAPGSVTLTVTPAAAALSCSWTTPTGSPYVYILAYRVHGATAWSTVHPNPTTTVASINNLTIGTEYDVQVWAMNGGGMTASSVVTGTPGTVPIINKVSQLFSQESGSGFASVTLTPVNLGDVITVSYYSAASISALSGGGCEWFNSASTNSGGQYVGNFYGVVENTGSNVLNITGSSGTQTTLLIEEWGAGGTVVSWSQNAAGGASGGSSPITWPSLTATGGSTTAEMYYGFAVSTSGGSGAGGSTASFTYDAASFEVACWDLAVTGTVQPTCPATAGWGAVGTLLEASLAQPWAPIQSASVTSASTLKYGNMVTAGNMLLCGIVSTASVTAVTDSLNAGASWSVAFQDSGIGGTYTSLFYYPNTLDGGVPTVTAHGATGGGFIIAEAAGIAQTSPLDKQASSSGSGTSLSSGATGTLTAALEPCFAVLWAQNGTLSTTGGFTMWSTAGANIGLAYLTASSTAAQTATGSTTSTGNYEAGIAVFKI